MIQDVYPNGESTLRPRPDGAGVPLDALSKFELRCGANDDEATWDPSTIPLNEGAAASDR